jgi:hypothetical protein
MTLPPMARWFGGVSNVEYFYEKPYQAIINSTDAPSRVYKTVVPCFQTPTAICGPHASPGGVNWEISVQVLVY